MASAKHSDIQARTPRGTITLVDRWTCPTTCPRSCGVTGPGDANSRGQFSIPARNRILPFSFDWPSVLADSVRSIVVPQGLRDRGCGRGPVHLPRPVSQPRHLFLTLLGDLNTDEPLRRIYRQGKASTVRAVGAFLFSWVRNVWRVTPFFCPEHPVRAVASTLSCTGCSPKAAA